MENRGAAGPFQVGGGAGRWNGPGVVYVMTYKMTQQHSTTTYYKIGCTSRDPEERLIEVLKKEQKHREDDKITITLVGFVHADKMRDAETVAQNALRRKGLVKDPTRGNATDWFTGNLTPEDVLTKVGRACGGPVYVKKDGISYYPVAGADFEESTLQFMAISAEAVKTANASRNSGYVHVLKIHENESPPYYQINCAQANIERWNEVVGSVYAKDVDHAEKEVAKTVQEKGYPRMNNFTETLSDTSSDTSTET